MLLLIDAFVCFVCDLVCDVVWCVRALFCLILMCFFLCVCVLIVIHVVTLCDLRFVITARVCACVFVSLCVRVSVAAVIVYVITFFCV